MESINLTAFDAAALAILIISALMALARGLLREVFSIVAFAVAMLVAIYGRGFVRPLFQSWIEPPLVAELSAAVALFLVVFIAVTVLTSFIARAAHSSSEIGAIDRGAGLVFGLARGVLVLALFIVLMRAVFGAPQAPMPDVLAKARLYPPLERAAVAIEAVFPKASSYILEETKGESTPPAQP